eukprot:1789823-Pyramimonas_sp.AAC.1
MDQGSGSYWLLLLLNAKQAVLAVGVCYLDGGLGVSGVNIDRLCGLAEFVGTLTTPWILMGDFNIPITDLDLS